jgi:hypothetical protein
MWKITILRQKKILFLPILAGANLSADTVNDKYFIDCNFFSCYENNVTEFEIFSEHVNYFENSKLHGSFKGVKEITINKILIINSICR